MLTATSDCLFQSHLSQTMPPQIVDQPAPPEELERMAQQAQREITEARQSIMGLVFVKCVDFGSALKMVSLATWTMFAISIASAATSIVLASIALHNNRTIETGTALALAVFAVAKVVLTLIKKAGDKQVTAQCACHVK